MATSSEIEAIIRRVLDEKYFPEIKALKEEVASLKRASKASGEKKALGLPGAKRNFPMPRLAPDPTRRGR